MLHFSRVHTAHMNEADTASAYLHTGTARADFIVCSQQWQDNLVLSGRMTSYRLAVKFRIEASVSGSISS
jgi:hypothetical protein